MKIYRKYNIIQLDFKNENIKYNIIMKFRKSLKYLNNESIQY